MRRGQIKQSIGGEFFEWLMSLSCWCPRAAALHFVACAGFVGAYALYEIAERVK